MSKHFKNLKKINKRQLGLKSSDFDTEIEALGTRRDSLASLIFEQKQLVEGAEILYDTVEEYHLKSAVDDNKAVNGVVSENLDSDTAISIISSLVVSFFKSTTSNNTNFISNATTYAEKSLDLYVDELLTSGKLTISTTSSGGGSVATFSIGGGGTEEGGSVVNIGIGKVVPNLLTSIIEYAESLEATANEVVANINSNSDVVALGISAKILSVEEIVTIQLDFSNSNFNGEIVSFGTSGDLTVIGGEVTGGEVVTVISKETKQAFNKAVSSYISIYEKLYKEYLPSFMAYDSSLISIDFKTYSKGDGELLEKSSALLETFTNFNTLTKEQKITLTEGFKKSISNAILNLKNEVGVSNTILTTYGSVNLENEKTQLEVIGSENDNIDALILRYTDEKDAIVSTTAASEQILSKVEASLADVDTTYITTNSLVNIISAASAHTEAIKVYAGKRLDTIIRDAASKGLFEVEVDTLTDIEAKILLDNGYELKESTDQDVIKGNIKSSIRPTWTISWEAGNSVAGNGFGK